MVMLCLLENLGLRKIGCTHTPSREQRQAELARRKAQLEVQLSTIAILVAIGFTSKGFLRVGGVHL